VEAAKLLYKAEKERYRAEREERRQAREQRTASGPYVYAFISRHDFLRPLFSFSPVNEILVDTSTAERAAEAPPAPAPVAHLVSTGNAKVGYPPLEMYSVPHRSKTYHGRPSRRHGHDEVTETPGERTINRITRRLAAVRTFSSARCSMINLNAADGNH
jgi:Wiskott-Aldrich syndrome protein